MEEATTEKFDKSCFQDVIPSLSTFSSCSSSSKSVITELCSHDNRRIIFCDKPLPEEYEKNLREMHQLASRLLRVSSRYSVTEFFSLIHIE